MGDVIKQILGRNVHQAELVIKAADKAASFKHECLGLKTRTSKLSELLRQAAGMELYEQPARGILDNTEQVLEKALSLTHLCQAKGFLKRAFTVIPNAAAFKKMFMQLEGSVGNITWLLRVSGAGAGGYFGLPPFPENEPILVLIWEMIGIVSVGPVDERAYAAGCLVSLAQEDKYVKMILEEGGVGPLLKLLKEGKTVEGRENAASALGFLGIADPWLCSVLKDGATDACVDRL